MQWCDAACYDGERAAVCARWRCWCSSSGWCRSSTATAVAAARLLLRVRPQFSCPRVGALRAGLALRWTPRPGSTAACARTPCDAGCIVNPAGHAYSWDCVAAMTGFLSCSRFRVPSESSSDLACSGHSADARGGPQPCAWPCRTTAGLLTRPGPTKRHRCRSGSLKWRRISARCRLSLVACPRAQQAPNHSGARGRGCHWTGTRILHLLPSPLGRLVGAQLTDGALKAPEETHLRPELLACRTPARAAGT